MARHIEAILIGAIFAEMTAPLMQPLFLAPSDPGDAQTFTRIADLTGHYAALAPRLAALAAADLGLPG